MIYKSYFDEEETKNYNFALILEKRFPKEEYEKIIRDIFSAKIYLAKEKLKQTLAEYETKISGGFEKKDTSPERIKIINDYIFEKINHSKSFKPVPFVHWIRHDDLPIIKQKGFISFINKFFELSYDHRNNDFPKISPRD